MIKWLHRFGVLLICFFSTILLFYNGSKAAEKKSVKRDISIVFDNSGSMYINDDAWCRATYAVEVFASMLNEGDTLRVYPMNKMTVKGTAYTMKKHIL